MSTRQTIEQMKSLFKNFSESNIRDRSKEYTQADLEFHNLIIRASRNDLLINIMNTLNDHVQMLRIQTVSHEGRPEQSLVEHFNIIQAMEQKDHFVGRIPDEGTHSKGERVGSKKF